MEDDRIERLQLAQERGVGVRVVVGGVTGYAYADGWDEASAADGGAGRPRSGARQGPAGQAVRLVAVETAAGTGRLARRAAPRSRSARRWWNAPTPPPERRARWSAR